jgi:TFIIF-interacting CTD phosphatase-like protein
MAAMQSPEFALQRRHHTAADTHKNAVKHYRQAALLHDRGDKEQAQTHANIARRHAVSALAAGEVSPDL